jgi:hypothetical protein
MAAFTFNVAKGRTIEFHTRVDGNDPANSVLVLVVLAAAGLESDDILRDKDTLADVLAGATNEVTNAGYSRIVLSDTGITAVTIDDANDWVTAALATQSFGGPNVAAGDSWSKLLVCYDSDSTSGTDANILPVTAHDLRINGQVVVPNGAPVVVSAPNGYVRAR